jgi:hypothetical protein
MPRFPPCFEVGSIATNFPKRWPEMSGGGLPVLIMVHLLTQSVVVGLIMGGFAAKNQTTIASMVVSLHSA